MMARGLEIPFAGMNDSFLYQLTDPFRIRRRNLLNSICRSSSVFIFFFVVSILRHFFPDDCRRNCYSSGANGLQFAAGIVPTAVF